MALILGSAYACLSAGYASQKIVMPRTEITQNARVSMALISADLRAACTLSPDAEFVGMTRTIDDAEADNLDFATHNYTPRHPREGDYCQESLYVEKDPETGELCLYRRRNPMIAMDPLSGGSKEEIARGLRGFKLEYYDGLDWYDSWGETKSASKQETSAKVEPNQSGLPLAVRVTLYLDSEPHRKTAATAAATAVAAPEAADEHKAPPLVFQTVARLNLAETAASASEGQAQGPDNGSDNGSGNNGAGNGSTPNNGNNQ